MTSAVIRGHKALTAPVCHGISKGFAPISGARAAKRATCFATITIALTLAVTAPAYAPLVPINENPEIRAKLLQGFIGDAIADNCPTIKARTIKALGNSQQTLRDYALEQGYEASVTRAFVTSKEEKAKFKAEAAEWLKPRAPVETRTPIAPSARKRSPTARWPGRC